MWFLRVCLLLLTILWGALALQGIYLIDRLGERVGAVDAGQIIYVIGIPTIVAAGLAALFLGTWRLVSRKFLGVAAGSAWLSFALLWPYGVVLTSGF